MAIFDTLHTDPLTCPWCGYEGEMTIQVFQDILPDAWQNHWYIGDTLGEVLTCRTCGHTPKDIAFDDDAICPVCYGRYQAAASIAWANVETELPGARPGTKAALLREEFARLRASGELPEHWTIPVRVTIMDGVLVSIMDGVLVSITP